MDLAAKLKDLSLLDFFFFLGTFHYAIDKKNSIWCKFITNVPY